MALKVNTEGKVVITSPDDAAKAMEMAYEIKEGIKEELEEYEELRLAVADYMHRAHIKQVTFPNMEKHGTLIQRHDSFWDRTELLALVKKAKPKTWKKVWQALTTRQPDREKIQESIKAGVISGDAISEAFKQKPQRPYVQVYDD
jgi:hypothetical protein